MKLNLSLRKDRLKLVLMVVIGASTLAFMTYISTIYRYGQYECPIRKLTGLECPGCGGTRMLKSILKLDIKSAFLFNPYMFITLPIISAFTTVETTRYVLKGKVSKLFDKILIIYAICTLAFGILRNII